MKIAKLEPHCQKNQHSISPNIKKNFYSAKLLYANVSPDLIDGLREFYVNP